MAQVKKLQNGGNPSKYITIDQVKWYDTPENRKAWELLASQGDGAAQDILATLNDASYDNTASVTRQGDRVEFHNMKLTGLDTRGEKQLTKGSNFWRDTFGNRTKNAAVDRWLKFTGINAQDLKKEDSPVGLGRLSHGNDASFIYHDQEDGSKLYSTGPQNIQNEKVIRDIFSNLGSTREDLEKKYNFDNWGENFWTLQNWYNVNRNYDIDALINRIKSGNASDSDIELLQLMRFNVGGAKNKPESTKITGLEFDDSFLNGITNADQIKQAADRANVGIKKGEDGNWYITGNTNFTNGTWYAGDLDFLEGTPYAGGAIHNGRLFTKQQVLSGDKDIVQHIAPYISAWRNASDYRSGYDAANNSGVRFVGDRLWNNTSNDHYGPFNVQFDPNIQYHRVWSKYFDDIDSKYPWNVTDVTGAYDGLNGRQILAYIDPSEQNKRDIGMFGADWVVYDPNDAGNPYQVFDNESDMRSALGLTQTSDPYGFSNNFTTSTWTNIGNQAYAIYDTIKTKGDQENTILIGEDGYLYLARKNQSGGFESPKRITNLDLLNQVSKNPKDYDNTTIDQLTAPVNNNATPETISNNADYILHALGKFHHGGVLKLAYGSTIHTANTTSSTKNTEDAKTDITKDHLLNGKDGGLSQAEKMQIGAALGDLAGVGISFMGPVGNIAGAVTGLGATATRFAADVKQDGFQAKDAWNAAIGAALDFASVIPFIGTGAKTAKALKVIKSAANPIMKVLSIAGAVNGAAAMSKVIAGEKVTSEDLQAIIGGLSSSLIAGKQFKDMLGDSKLASMVSKRVADSANASKSIAPKAKIGNTEIELDVAKINDKSEAEVIKYIKETAKTKLGRELKDSESKGLLEQFGLNVTKGEKAGMRWKNLLKFKNPVVRKSGKVEFETPEDVSGNETLYYMLNPFARQKALGMGWHGFAHNKGLLSEISENDIKGAQRRIKNNKGSLKDYALMRQTIDNPTAFGDIFEGTPYRLSKLGYPTYTRSLKSSSNDNAQKSNILNNETAKTPNSIVPSQKLLSTSTANTALIPVNKINASAGDVTFKRSPIVETAQNIRTVNDIRPLQQRPAKWRRLNAPQQQNNVEIVVGPDGVAKIGNRSQRFLNESQDLMQYYLKYRQYQQALNNVNSEKSFKRLLNNMQNDVTLKLMLEDQPGLLRNEFTAAKQRIGLTKRTIGDIDLKFKQGGILKGRRGLNNLPYVTMPKSVAEKQPFSNEQVSKTQQYIFNKAFVNKDPILTKSTETITGDGRNNQYDVDWNKLGIKSIGLANLLRTFGEQRKFRSLNEKDEQSLLQTQGSTPPKPNFKFQNPISTQYNSDLANLFLQTKYQNQQTSDAKIQAANNAYANKLAMDHLNNMRQQESAAWSDYLNKQDANHNQWQQAAWQNDLRNAQIRNAANSIVTNGERNLLSQESAILNNAAYAAQNDLFKQGRINNLLTQQKSQLDLLISDAILNGKDPSGYQKLRKQIDNPEYISNIIRNSYYAKKGGKLRSTSDQMLIDNQKQVAKAIEKLNDNTMKLILKALS